MALQYLGLVIRILTWPAGGRDVSVLMTTDNLKVTLGDGL